MLSRRIFLALIAAGSLAACAGPAPTESVLNVATRSNLQISQVTVDVSEMGARSKGRAVPAGAVKAMVSDAGNALLRGQGNGPRKARAELVVEDVNIITAGQSMLIGGESTMSGRLKLVDAKTGQPILESSTITSGGGGWVGGGLVAVATRDDPTTEMRQMSIEFASRARVLVFGQNGTQIASATGTAAKPLRAAKPDGAVRSESDDLEARVREARREAKLEARRRHSGPCISVRCENDIQQSAKEAEERVRREAALASN